MIRPVLKRRGASTFEITSSMGFTCWSASNGSISAIVERKVCVVCSGGSAERMVMYPLAGSVSFPENLEP